MTQKILLHACCAHCLAKTAAGLRQEMGGGIELRGLWYNPNIHPLLEYRRRLKAVKVYLERDPVPFDFADQYGLIPFCEALQGLYAAPGRCVVCYAMRLDYTAAHAARLGMKAFTSTLICSAHQDHRLIRAAGEAAAAQHGVEFLYRDLRQAQADERLLRDVYRQQYCGCAFSEQDRFEPTSKHVYHGSGPAASKSKPET